MLSIDEDAIYELVSWVGHNLSESQVVATLCEIRDSLEDDKSVSFFQDIINEKAENIGCCRKCGNYLTPIVGAEIHSELDSRDIEQVTTGYICEVCGEVIRN